MVFSKTHYGVHVYRSTVEERMKFTCDVWPIFPFVCNHVYQGGPSNINKAQPITENRKLFIYPMNDGVFANMPPGFNVLEKQPHAVPADSGFPPYAAPDGFTLPYIGSHMWNPSKQPNIMSEWVDPQLVMGTFDGNIAFWEPMIPIDFINNDGTFKEKLTYESQTIKELPFKYLVSSTNGTVTIKMKGECK